MDSSTGERRGLVNVSDALFRGLNWPRRARNLSGVPEAPFARSGAHGATGAPPGELAARALRAAWLLRHEPRRLDALRHAARLALKNLEAPMTDQYPPTMPYRLDEEGRLHPQCLPKLRADWLDLGPSESSDDQGAPEAESMAWAEHFEAHNRRRATGGMELLNRPEASQ